MPKTKRPRGRWPAGMADWEKRYLRSKGIRANSTNEEIMVAIVKVSERLEKFEPPDEAIEVPRDLAPRGSVSRAKRSASSRTRLASC